MGADKTMTESKNMTAFKRILGAVSDLCASAELLDWDMHTFMPPGSIDSRSHQIATLQETAHEKMVSPELGKLLGKLEKETADLDPDSDDFRLVRKIRREYDRETGTPADWVRRNAEAAARANTAWEKAREQNSFKIFEPSLRELLQLKLEYISFFPKTEHPYDILLDRFDEGMTCSAVSSLFSVLKKEQGKILRKALSRKYGNSDFLKGKFPAAKQIALTRKVLTRMGFDWNCGRQDRSIHPFTASFGLYDVRITTKTLVHAPFSSLFSSIHEGGHALYEQGIDKRYARTPFAEGASFSVHESQSRLWENIVARSPEFWKWFYPEVCAAYPDQLKGISMKKFLAALNKPEASPIRTEADELTYNMHIILRFELEKAMIEGTLKTEDLPDAWNQGMKKLLGIEVKNDKEGVLQDIHWAMGEFGYFPSYAVGNVISAQVWDAALEELPSIPKEIGKGNFAPLREWLRTNLHCYGAKYTTSELLEKITSSPLPDPKPYLEMLNQKYGE